MEALGAKVILIENPVVDISSTQLRRLLVFECAGEYLSRRVYDYIRSNGLYGTGKSYRGLSLEQLEEEVCQLVDPKRVAHIMGCRKAAQALARFWGEDETLAARAALLHDVTKALDGKLQLTLCREYGIVLDAFFARNPKVLHAYTGALVAERIFGEDEKVVTAIRWHTTARAGMTTLDKIIYLADYIEENRNFPGVEQLRKLSFENLDKAMILGLTQALAYVEEQGNEVSPESREALMYFKKSL